MNQLETWVGWCTMTETERAAFAATLVRNSVMSVPDAQALVRAPDGDPWQRAHNIARGH